MKSVIQMEITLYIDAPEKGSSQGHRPALYPTTTAETSPPSGFGGIQVAAAHFQIAPLKLGAGTHVESCFHHTYCHATNLYSASKPMMQNVA